MFWGCDCLSIPIQDLLISVSLSPLMFAGFSVCCMNRHVPWAGTVYPKKYAHGFVVLCFVVVMQSFIMNSHEVFIHIHQGCFAGTGAIVRLPQCQWSKPDGHGKISQCITTTKHSKAKTACIFLGIYCICREASLFYTKIVCCMILVNPLNHSLILKLQIIKMYIYSVVATICVL